MLSTAGANNVREGNLTSSRNAEVAIVRGGAVAPFILSCNMIRHFTARSVYYLAARVSEGLTPQLVKEARELLDAHTGDRESYVAGRLREMARFGVRSDRQSLWTPTSKPVARVAIEALGDRVSGNVLRKTSGSSGMPFRFPRSKEMLRRMDAVMWAAYSWYDITPGDRHGVLWGRPFQGRARLRKKVSDWVLSRSRYNAFNVSAEESLKYFGKLRSFGATWIYGYPSLTSAFVQHCVDHGLDGRALNLKAVVMTGEMLTDVARAQLGDFFGAPIVNEYGCTEVGLLAFECTAGSMHTMPGAAIIESLDEAGRPVCDSPAALAVTDLFPSAFTFDRLLLGDRGILHQPASPCRCGRTLPVLSDMLGRVDSWIVLPTGKLVYDAILAYNMPTEVLRFQGEQTSATDLVVRMIVRSGAAVNTNQVARGLREALDDQISVDVQVVDDIPLSPSGKLRYFIPLG